MAARFDATTRPSLLRRIKDLRDQEAWKEFVATYSPWIHGFCLSRPGLASYAADMTQEILVKLTQQMPAFEYDSNRRFRAWLYRLMRNAVYDYQRRIRARPDQAAGVDVTLVDPDDSRFDESAMAAARALDDDFVRRLAGHYLDRAEELLPAEQRDSQSWQTFRLLYERDTTVDQVASQLGLTVGAVQLRRVRARQWLRDLGLDSAEAIRNSEGDL
ncbi:MAG: sigma-70 family RNA polymerase sigma factor [Pirellulaceae bacterium]|nr:sigma-70 family RNA polymerase sigma factor [Pirellulaceae bacterium]